MIFITHTPRLSVSVSTYAFFEGGGVGGRGLEEGGLTYVPTL